MGRQIARNGEWANSMDWLGHPWCALEDWWSESWAFPPLLDWWLAHAGLGALGYSQEIAIDEGVVTYGPMACEVLKALELAPEEDECRTWILKGWKRGDSVTLEVS